MDGRCWKGKPADSRCKAMILLNSMASSVDVLSMFLIITQAPAGSHLTGNGSRTYWKQM